MRILGIDYGDARVGIAITDDIHIIMDISTALVLAILWDFLDICIAQIDNWNTSKDIKYVVFALNPHKGNITSTITDNKYEI